MTEPREPFAIDAATAAPLGPPPTSPRAKAVFVLLACAAIGGVGALVFEEEVARALEPSPRPFVEEDLARFASFMRETLPTYVIAVGRRDGDDLSTIHQAFVDGARFHDGLARRCQAIADAVEAFLARGERALAPKPERVKDALARLNDEVLRLDRMLRDIGAPFSVSHDIGALKENGRYKLRFLVRGSEVLSVSEFHVDGGGPTPTARVARVRRVDNLNVLDLVHGLTREDIAYVLEGNAKKDVMGRYLPALGGDRVLRDMFEEAAEPSPDDAIIIERLVLLLPEDIRPFREEMAALARERRALLEETKLHLERRKIRIIPPEDFFLQDRACDDYARWVSLLGGDDYHARLSSFCARDTTVSPAMRARIDRAVSTLADHFVRGVERHEAWHIVAPDPPPLVDAPQQAAKEIVAYLGALADATDEQCIQWDRLRASMREAAKTTAFTATEVAFRALSSRFAGHRLVDETARDCTPAGERARALLGELFDERRALRLIDARTGREVWATSAH